ncbi:MAG TPA: 23S rRNA (adenine(2503)-C(2))-methyltransferase RlmN [Syntrophorhabdaceae bacterium]|nr:23S rRNA (adenine(2503)-C(2))-methyltransferase RlmN [Syntrophorhabdaceae bacterium]
MQSFFGLTLKDLEATIGAAGREKFRARQLYTWIYAKSVFDFNEMTDIPKSLRQVFRDMFSVELLEIKEVLLSGDGSRKFALSAADGHIIESIIMPEKERNTLCISSQIGCRMGCKFCVTGKIGFKRNLTAAEIVNQVVTVKEYLKGLGEGRITNIVFMGMGEPMDNLDNVVKALTILKESIGLDFSYRRITVSSVGLLDGIRTLPLKTASIALSLNAADDETRSRLMPINRLYPIGQIVDYVRSFQGPNRIRTTFEYVIIKDVNDSPEDARRLADLLKGVKCKINLIPYNTSPYLEFMAPDAKSVTMFHDYLYGRHFTTMIRDSRGQDVAGACGQLGMRYLKGCET